jgi:hypothetical protein
LPSARPRSGAGCRYAAAVFLPGGGEPNATLMELNPAAQILF